MYTSHINLVALTVKPETPAAFITCQTSTFCKATKLSCVLHRRIKIVEELILNAELIIQVAVMVAVGLVVLSLHMYSEWQEEDCHISPVKMERYSSKLSFSRSTNQIGRDTHVVCRLDLLRVIDTK